ncbi:MAG: helix-turn-helix transcriptional regulator, partial [Rhizobiales bacterium]|nr:helix-turn-helix transcriptional regulator [Hyphomicrobiales bacterium]
EETTDFFFTSDSDPEWIQKFFNHYIETNPYPQPLHELAPAGIPLIDDMVLSRDEARKTDYYKGWVKPQGLDITQIGCKVTIDKDRFIILGTHVDPNTFDIQNQFYHSVLTTLIPHITRSIKINQILKEHHQTQKNLHDIFDRLDLAIFIVDQKFRIQTLNGLAEKLLKRGDLILVDNYSQSLVCADKDCTDQFYTALKKCFSNNKKTEQQTLCLTSTIDKQRYVTWAQLANQEHMTQFNNKTEPFHFSDEAPLIAVLISLPQSHKGPPVEIVQSILGVTSAEAKLATALANGETLKSYALQTKISHNTARGQLSSIFHKTGIKRQAELVAHIWRSFGPLRLK